LITIEELISNFKARITSGKILRRSNVKDLVRLNINKKLKMHLVKITNFMATHLVELNP